MRRALGLAIVLAMGAGCGKQPSDLVVADVGPRKITVGELIAFQRKLPESLRTEKPGVEGQKDYLQTLIDKHLMFLEAKARGLEKDYIFVERFNKEVGRKLRYELIKSEVWPKITVSEEEMRQYYEEHDLGRAIRVRHIQVADEDQARKVLEELKKGRSFEELVRKYSLDTTTVDKGGDLGRYFRRDEAIYAIGDVVWNLKPGEVSEPIKAGKYYEIVQVIDQKTIPFEDWRPRLHRALWRNRLYIEQEAFLERLRKELRLRLHEDNLELLLAKERESGEQPPVLSEEELQLPLYTFDGGQITLGDYLKNFRRLRGRPHDREKLLGYVNLLLPERLLSAAAYRYKIDRISEVAAWIEEKREELLIRLLRKREVEDKVQISDQEVREEYEKHKMDIYSLPEERDFIEILVPTEEQAKELLRRIQAGEDMEELAARYTIRKGKKKLKGKFHMHPFERAVYGKYYDIVMNAPIGKLMGPIKVEKGYVSSDTGYAIFKVTGVLPRRPEPYETAKRRVRANLRHERESRMFEEFIRRLREKYRDQVRIYEDNLQVVLEELARA
ncbi:MAG TPA: hypothetical protein EYP17_02585 [Candidatus Latescibacteria bacterium]|nr:hypothetical protein [Candidatus Latescibacterota bacterium]